MSRVQASALPQAVLTRAYRRLATRVEDLDAQLEVDSSAWPDYCDAVRALASIVPRLGDGEMLTTAEMAGRLGISPKTLLKHKKAKAITPAVQRGKLIRWRGDEAPK